MAVDLGLDSDYFEGMLRGNMSVTNLVYYGPTPGGSPDRRVRLGAHTDFGTLTILKDDGQEGLEI